MTASIDRFFQVLCEEIEGSARSAENHQFTVAEIYQSLIPYRTHRDRLGVEMNGDYEDALLRLLAGEGEFLLLESEAARSRIRQELAQSNPNTGIYREFAAVGVRLNPGRVEDRPASRPALATESAPIRTPAETPAPVAATPARKSAGSARACPDCGGDLPARDSLRFCPHCGTNVLLAPCTACGEILERSWKFCLSCGTATR
jgi:hypothetical protein